MRDHLPETTRKLPEYRDVGVGLLQTGALNATPPAAMAFRSQEEFGAQRLLRAQAHWELSRMPLNQLQRNVGRTHGPRVDRGLLCAEDEAQAAI